MLRVTLLLGGARVHCRAPHMLSKCCTTEPQPLTSGMVRSAIFSVEKLSELSYKLSMSPSRGIWCFASFLRTTHLPHSLEPSLYIYSVVVFLCSICCFSVAETEHPDKKPLEGRKGLSEFTGDSQSISKGCQTGSQAGT